MSGIKRVLKKRKKVIMTLAIFVVAAVAGGIFYFRNAAANEVSADAIAMQSATAEIGSIAKTVVGAGNIAAATAENVIIPAGITVNEILVESGDTVAEGDILATLDAHSIIAKMASVQSEIEEIDAELNDLDSDLSETIDTYIAGRVKRIYAAKGSSVTETMGEYGALIVLSIDGKMAVDLETSAALSVGDDVDVILADGSTVDGTVSKSSSSQMTVTMTDNGPALDETVTVNDASGNTIGTGTLYVNQPVSITGASGIVDSVDVSEGKKVSAKETLLTLTDVSVSSEYLELIAIRESLVKTLTQLSTLAQDNTIKATFSGTVESVNLTEGEAAGSSDSSDTSSGSNPLASTANGTSVAAATISSRTGIELLTASAETTETNADQMISTLTAGAGSSPVEINELIGFKITAPVKGATPQREIDAMGLNYSGKISWAPTALSTFAAEQSYTATVTLSANADYIFSSALTAAVIADSLGLDNISVTNVVLSDTKDTLTFNVIFPATEAEVKDTPETQDDNQNQNSPGTTGNIGTTGTTGNTGSAATGNSTTASSTSSDSTNDSASTYATEDAVTAFTIAPNDSVSVSITVDELDILSIEKGQTAAITLDAVDGEFAGEVSSISDTATTSGGVVSYTVDISLTKEDTMKIGMSANATITIDQAENIVILPASAIQERGNTIFVYTEMDSETNELSGEVEVTTGLSDGNFVEITSGLSEGDTVYYIVITASSDSSSSEAIFIDMGGGMGSSTMGGGERPSGSMPEGMPEGGMPSGGQ